MCNFILQESIEKSNEIRLKTEHDFNLEKQTLLHNAKLRIQDEFKEMEKEIGELDVNPEDEDSQWAVDDRNGELLDVKMVKEARNEEVKFMGGLGVWERSSLEECR